MSQWGKNDNAANSTLWGPAAVNKAPTATERDRLFGNTTVGAYVANAAVGQFGITAAEIGGNPPVAHTGWTLRQAGTGPLESITINTAGRLYANSDTFVVAAPAGGANASGNVVTNAAGNVASFEIKNAGRGFTAKNPTVTITTAAGTGLSATGVAGGRAGRVTFETLVAMGSLT